MKIIKNIDLKVTESGFLIDGVALENCKSDDIFQVNDLYHVVRLNQLDNSLLDELLKDKTKLNRIFIPVTTIDEADIAIQKCSSVHPIISSYILTKFDSKKNTTLLNKHNENIVFSDDQELIKKSNLELMTFWKEKYFLTEERRKFFPQKIIESEVKCLEEEQNQYIRYVAFKNKKIVSELSYLPFFHDVFKQNVNLMSAIIDETLSKEERSYIWQNLFNYIHYNGFFLSAISNYNLKSLNLFMKNKFKLDHIFIAPKRD